MVNLMRNSLIVIGMLVSKWFAIRIFLSIPIPLISIFMAEPLKAPAIMLFIVITSIILGFLYAYSTRFLKDIHMNYKILTGFLLLSVGLLFLYIQVILPTQAIQSICEAEKQSGEFSIFNECAPIINLNILLLLYSLSFILTFGLCLWKSKSKLQA